MQNNIRSTNSRSNIKNVSVLYGSIVLFAVAAGMICVSAGAAQQDQRRGIGLNGLEAGTVIDIDSVLQLVFSRNPEVVSARYALGQS